MRFSILTELIERVKASQYNVQSLVLRYRDQFSILGHLCEMYREDRLKLVNSGELLPQVADVYDWQIADKHGLKSFMNQTSKLPATVRIWARLSLTERDKIHLISKSLGTNAQLIDKLYDLPDAGREVYLSYCNSFNCWNDTYAEPDQQAKLEAMTPLVFQSENNVLSPEEEAFANSLTNKMEQLHPGLSDPSRFTVLSANKPEAGDSPPDQMLLVEGISVHVGVDFSEKGLTGQGKTYHAVPTGNSPASSSPQVTNEPVPTVEDSPVPTTPLLLPRRFSQAVCGSGEKVLGNDS